MKRARWCGRLVFALVSVGLATVVVADEVDEPEGWAYEMAGEMLSPFCPGVTLAECSSGHAESLRLWIIVQEAAGRTRADVEAELHERYGDAIRSAPRAEGIGLTAYALPILAFLGGGGFLAWFLRRSRNVASQPPVATSNLDPDLARIVDEEIAR